MQIHGQLWVVILVVSLTLAASVLRFLAEWLKYREAILKRSESRPHLRRKRVKHRKSRRLRRKR